MICPECGSEYREGFTHCSDCDVDLVEPEAEEPEVDLVKVYESGNPAIIPIVESVLRDAPIEFLMKGNVVQALQGAVGSPYAVPVEFWVRSDDEAAAREILEGIEDAPIVDE
jgi:Putative prokaryotic signal transducing protein